MNQDIVQERLEKLYPEEGGARFQVIFNGKKSTRVNGKYIIDNHDIIIFNLNFKHEGALMYTAIHELAHHILVMQYGTLGKGHPSLFWATFHDLLAQAEKLHLWKTPDLDDEQTELVEEIAALLPRVTALEMEIGSKLMELHASVEESGGRIEDLIDRKLRMSKTSAKLFQKLMAKLDDAIYNPDAAKLIATSGARTTAESSYANGMSLDQTKQDVKGIKKRVTAISDNDRRKALIIRLTAERKKVEERLTAVASRRLSLDAELASLGYKEEKADDED